jgi:hypothetical protein
MRPILHRLTPVASKMSPLRGSAMYALDIPESILDKDGH